MKQSTKLQGDKSRILYGLARKISALTSSKTSEYVQYYFAFFLVTTKIFSCQTARTLNPKSWCSKVFVRRRYTDVFQDEKRFDAPLSLNLRHIKYGFCHLELGSCTRYGFQLETIIGNAFLIKSEVSWDNIDDADLTTEQVADLALDPKFVRNLALPFPLWVRVGLPVEVPYEWYISINLRRKRTTHHQRLTASVPLPICYANRDEKLCSSSIIIFINFLR